MSFWRGLINQNLNSWFDLVVKVVPNNLTNRKDVFRWNLDKNGLSVVWPMYKNMIQQGVLLEKNPTLEITGITRKLKFSYGT